MPGDPDTERAPINKFPWTWALLLLAAAGLALFLSDFQAASAANPRGEWDALSIWNLRAHLLAGGPETWRRAVSAELGGHLTGAAHPGYPLFLSGFIALQFVAGGDAFSTTVPIVASLLFSLAAFLLLGSGLASKKSVALGAMGWLILLCSEVFASQAASQYSDLLQGLAFLAALVLLDRALDSSPKLLFAAGLALGLAAWVKNEGLPFALAGLAVAAWRFRGKAVWTVAGSVPGLIALAVLKVFIAQGRETVFPSTVGEMVAKLAMPGRWWQALLGFGKAIIDAGDPWAHPVILGAAIVLVLGFVTPAERRNQWPLWIPVAATAAAEYGLYLVTSADLDWHISTSVSRLLAQLWPPLIWLVLSMLRTPDEYFADSRSARRLRARECEKKHRMFSRGNLMTTSSWPLLRPSIGLVADPLRMRQSRRAVQQASHPANEIGAVAMMKSIATAEVSYNLDHGQFAPSLDELRSTLPANLDLRREKRLPIQSERLQILLLD